MKKALFIVGPTAVGKTDLAFNISTKCKSALINADSVQIYKGLDLISGKDLPLGARRENDHYSINQTPIYLLDVADPTKPFSIFDFVKLSKNAISKILSEKRLPIIVGGTRFYIEALTKEIETFSIAPDRVLRARLEGLTVSDLQVRLGNINPQKLERMNKSDRNNKRRLVRAIEVTQVQGRTLGMNASARSQGRVRPYFKESEVLMIGLITSYESLKKRIGMRLDKRIKEGAFKEARKLFENYNKLSNQVKNTNGYKQLFEFFMGEVNLETAIERWKFSEYHLAKKQLSWLKNKKNVNLFDTENRGFEGKILRLIRSAFA